MTSGKETDMKKDALSGALRRALNRRPAVIVQVLLFAVSCAAFYYLAMHARYAMIDEFAAYGVERMTRITATVYGMIFAMSLAVQLRMARRLPLAAQVLAAVITGAVLLGKISLLDYLSDDYQIFLSDWIYSYSHMGIKEGLGTYIGSDYTPPYLYFMLLVSRVGSFPWQYLVKAISIAFEVLMAWALASLAGFCLKGDGAKLAVFHMSLLLPTVVFNGAYWGQCDVIYTSLCLTALYMGLTKRSARCMIFYGVALSFKLQMAFFLPALLPLWLRKDIKLRHLPLIPATYMAMMIPAFWGGKSLHHVLTVYLVQAGGYSFITMNGPSLWQLLPEGNGSMFYDMLGGMALLMGMGVLVAACALICARREPPTHKSSLLFALLILGGVPLFLPKMHERYTFGADVLSLTVAVQNPKYAPLPLLYGFASYVCYTAALNGDTLMPLKWATMFQMAAVALTAAALISSLRPDPAAQVMEVKA